MKSAKVSEEVKITLDKGTSIVNDYSVLFMSLGFIVVFTTLVVLYANNSSAVVTLPNGQNTTLGYAVNVTGSYSKVAAQCTIGSSAGGIIDGFISFFSALPTCLGTFTSFAFGVMNSLFILAYLYPVLAIPLGIASLMVLYVIIKLAASVAGGAI